MLNKFATSAKLYLLIFITAVSLIGLGIYGVAVLEKMDANTQTLYADRILPFQQLANIRFTYAAEIVPTVKKVKDRSITSIEAKKRILNAQHTIDVNWHDYGLTYLTPEEVVLFKQTDELKKQVDNACGLLLVALTKEGGTELNDLIHQKNLNENNPFVIKLTRLMNLQVRVSKQIFDSNNKIYRSSRQKFILLILLSLFIALSLSVLIIKNIKKLIGDILNSHIGIKESEEKYQSLFQQASDAIYVVNGKGYFTDINYSMCKMIGYTRDELLAMNISDLLSEELLRMNPLLYAKANPGESVKGERKVITKTGEIIDVEVNGRKFNDDRAVVIVRDITDRKQMESELKKAELKFRTLADKSMVGIYIVQRGKFVYVNPRFAEIFGYLPDELIGAPPVETIIHPEYQATAYENIRLRVEDEASSVNYEAMGRKKDGSTNWVEFYGSRAVMEDEPTIIGSMIDITERFTAELLLKKTDANLQTILNSTDTAYALLDRNLDALTYNTKAGVFAQIEFDFDPQKGNNFFEHLPENRRGQFLEYIDAVFKGTPINYEVIYDQSGQNVWYHVRMFPISNNENEILGLVLAIDDITERKKAEQSLQGAYEQIKTQIDFIREMVWKQSHILRSPLANLKALTTLLLNDPADKEVLGYMEIELERMDTAFIEMARDSAGDEMNH